MPSPAASGTRRSDSTIIGRVFYDASTATFLSRDPIRRAGSEHSYVNSRPTNFVDPFGENVLAAWLARLAAEQAIKATLAVVGVLTGIWAESEAEKEDTSRLDDYPTIARASWSIEFGTWRQIQCVDR
jgi:hypothetical protein